MLEDEELSQEHHKRVLLWRAIEEGDLESVIDVTNNDQRMINGCLHGGQTPLMYAIATNQEEIALHLIKAGAKVNVKDQDGWSPFLFAAALKNQTVIEALLQAGADPLSLGNFNMDALQVHLQFDEYDITDEERLIAFQRIYGLLKPQALKHPYGQDDDNEANCNLLHYTCQYGTSAEVEFLISEGWDPNQKDESGRSAVHHAALRGNCSDDPNEDQIKILDTLLRGGANLKLKTKGQKTVLSILRQDPTKGPVVDFLIPIINALSEKEALLKITAPKADKAKSLAIHTMNEDDAKDSLLNHHTIRL